MKSKKFVSFKEQMKKILIFYSLIPIIVTALFGYGMIYYLNYRSVVNSNKDNLNLLSYKTDILISQIYSEMEDLIKNPLIKKAIINKKVNKSTYELLYKSS